MYEIEKGVPIPSRPTGGRPRGRCGSKYPFERMEIGDSFVAPPLDTAVLSGTIKYWSDQLGHEYQRARIPAGTRIWRIK